MHATFIGTGEACDPDNPNTSLVLECFQNRHIRIMLDCGFTTPHHYFKTCADPDSLDALVISHFHGDHYFGVPLLLLHFWELERRKPLTITGLPGIQKKIYDIMELAYPGIIGRLRFHIAFVEIKQGMQVEVAGIKCTTAESEHSQRNLAVRFDCGSESFFYSGDGRATSATRGLAQGCDLIVHESYGMHGDTPGHGSVQASIEFARQAGAKKLALVHMSRLTRKKHSQTVAELNRDMRGMEIIVPKPGDVIYI